MEIITIRKEVKKFTELTEKQQKECIEKNRESYYNIVDDYMLDSVINDIVPMLNDLGFLTSEKNIEYNVNYVQGRGACFTCKNFEFNLLLENLNIPHKKWFIDILNSQYTECELEKTNYHYSHENTVTTNIYFYDRGKNAHSRIFNMLTETICDYIEKLRHDTCLKMCNDLTNTFEYYISDDFIKEDFINNEAYFDGLYNVYYDLCDMTYKFLE